MLRHLVAHGLADAQAGAPPFHASRRVGLILHLNTDGRPHTPAVTVATGPPEPSGKAAPLWMELPDPGRTSGIVPALAADTAEYVLGWRRRQNSTFVEDPKTPQRREAFRDLALRWHRDYPQDPSAAAVAAFCRSTMVIDQPDDDDHDGSRYLVISVSGRYAHQSPTVADLWPIIVAERKGHADLSGPCVFCGQLRPQVRSIPTPLAQSLLPGASQRAALMSINSKAYGYDLHDDLRHVPVCLQCADALTAGATIQLGDPTRSRRLAYQDSVLTWWTSSPEAAAIATAVIDTLTNPADALTRHSADRENSQQAENTHAADPAAVAALLDGLRSGKDTQRDLDTTRFNAILAGYLDARFVVRSLMDLPLADAVRHVRAWMDDHRILGYTPSGPAPRCHGIHAMAAACEPPPLNKKKPPPRRSARLLYRAALTGAPIPPELARKVIDRIAAGDHVTGPRAALLRLYYNRRQDNTMTIPAEPDVSAPLPTAYHYGRLLALLADIQRVSNDNQTPNRAFVDRHLRLALRNPHSVFVRGIEMAASAWLPRIRNSGRAGLAEYFSDRLAETVRPIEAAELVTTTTLDDQAALVLGYCHGLHDRAQRRKPDTDANMPATVPT